MNLTGVAALAYVNSMVDKLAVTEEARESIRRFTPQKMKLVKGFALRNDGGAVVKKLVSGGHRELLRIHTGACWRKLESTDNVNVPGNYIALGADLWIDDVLYISTPAGLAPREFETDYISLPINQALIDELVRAGAIEPRDLLVVA